MELTICIDQQRCIEWKINLTEGSLMHILSKLSTWAKPVVVDGETYYFISRNKIITELPIITGKSDTIYKLLNKLDGMGLISYKKFDGKDLVRLTEIGRKWNSRDDSEKNPSVGKKLKEVGKKSESDSEKNPTYQDTIQDQKLNDPVQQVSIFFESSENENQAPQVKAQILEEEQEPHIKENNICSGLKETEYKQALMTLLKKFAREYWDRPDIDTFLEYCWVEGKKFEIKKYGMKKTVPGLLELLKAHFEGDVGEMNKKKAEVAADHSEIEGLVEKTIEYCNKWWKDEWRLYPELINMRKSHEKEKAAIKKLLMRNKKKEVSLIMFVYWKEPMVMNQRMESDWVSIEGNFNNVLELALEMYNMKSSWNHPDWPKQ